MSSTSASTRPMSRYISPSSVSPGNLPRRNFAGSASCCISRRCKARRCWNSASAGGREAPFLDRARLFHQRRIHRHRQPGDLLLGFLGDCGKHLRLDRLLAFRRLRDGQRGLAGFGETRGELGQITAFTEELALGVDDFQVHAQMAFDLLRRLGPGFITDPGTGHAQQLAAQRLGQRALGEGRCAARRP